MANSKTAKPNH